jgi:hypothetical protein
VLGGLAGRPFCELIGFGLALPGADDTDRGGVGWLLLWLDPPTSVTGDTHLCFGRLALLSPIQLARGSRATSSSCSEVSGDLLSSVIQNMTLPSAALSGITITVIGPTIAKLLVAASTTPGMNASVKVASLTDIRYTVYSHGSRHIISPALTT